VELYRLDPMMRKKYLRERKKNDKICVEENVRTAVLKEKKENAGREYDAQTGYLLFYCKRMIGPDHLPFQKSYRHRHPAKNISNPQFHHSPGAHQLRLLCVKIGAEIAPVTTGALRSRTPSGLVR
jgi:hypothetical protein